jgi:replicative DNA helicase
MDTIKALPSNVDAERALLGAMMRHPGVIDSVRQTGLVSDDFYRETHRVLYSCLILRAAEGKPVDGVSVWDSISPLGEKAGTNEQLVDIMAAGEVPISAPNHARIIIRESAKRRALKACAELSQRAATPGTDVADVLSGMEALVQDCRIEETATKSFEELLQEAVATMQNIKAGDPGAGRCPTGFRDLDALIAGGLEAASIAVIAGRPSMGKSTLCYNIGYRASTAGKRVLIASYETSPLRIVLSILLGAARVSNFRAMRGTLNEEEVARLIAVAGQFATNGQIFVPDLIQRDVMDCAAEIRRHRNEHKIDLAIVDYIQCLEARSGRRKVESRQQEVSEISRVLKGCAKSLGIPLILVSQLSRQCEQREDKHPELSDLRDSGAIEQDADYVLMLYRDEYYDANSPDKGICEASLKKNRCGPTGVVKLTSMLDFCRFEDFAHVH